MRRNLHRRLRVLFLCGRPANGVIQLRDSKALVFTRQQETDAVGKVPDLLYIGNDSHLAPAAKLLHTQPDIPDPGPHAKIFQRSVNIKYKVEPAGKGYMSLYF